MTAALLLALFLGPGAGDCTATTDIPRFKDEIHRACDDAKARFVKSASLTGDIEKVTLVMTYTFDWTGRQAAGTPAAVLARDAAIVSHDYFYARMPMKVFELVMRDTKDQEMCSFTFEGETLKRATCMRFVGREPE